MFLCGVAVCAGMPSYDSASAAAADMAPRQQEHLQQPMETVRFLGPHNTTITFETFEGCDATQQLVAMRKSLAVR